MAGKGDGMGAPQNQSGPESPVDKQGPGYDNNVADDWRRGGGANQAEGKPGYVKTGSNPQGIK
jgi:hypothetical protein